MSKAKAPVNMRQISLMIAEELYIKMRKAVASPIRTHREFITEAIEEKLTRESGRKAKV